ncbi:MAG: hypothetical protein LUD02_12265 [Tannerellaceae bacterium]|nr:hypothetical protein [Tannerellaceae bacterium]MCD8264819.1 hypothetical protein [Tannerellaceae bacterium]
MKKLLLVVLYVVIPMSIFAQQQIPDYIRKGDEAMLRQDYPDAKMWYEEGVSFCNLYCIEQLTHLWLEHERMRTSMRSLMTRCLNCLNNMALEEDTTAIKLLEVYYREGIGTAQNEELADYWVEKLFYIQHPDAYTDRVSDIVKQPKEPMTFFVGYAYSIEAPFGVTIGGVVGRLGWYARFKTNASFYGYDTTCNDIQLAEPPSGFSYEFSGKKKLIPMWLPGELL